MRFRGERPERGGAGAEGRATRRARARRQGSHPRAGRESEGGHPGPLSPGPRLHSWRIVDDPTLEPEDEVLAHRAAQGDESAFEALVTRFQGRVYRLVRRLTRSDGDAEDVLQETFLQAYRGLHAFRSEARFSTWLYRIATNA